MSIEHSGAAMKSGNAKTAYETLCTRYHAIDDFRGKLLGFLPLATGGIFLLAEKDEIVPPRYHRLVVNAYAGEKRVIALHGAYHNDPIEGAAQADLNNAVGWLLKTSSAHAP